jgi:hypothetical protein
MSKKNVETKKSPTFTMVVEYDTDGMLYTDIIEAVQHLVEEATGQGYVVKANIVNLPNEIEII